MRGEICSTLREGDGLAALCNGSNGISTSANCYRIHVTIERLMSREERTLRESNHTSTCIIGCTSEGISASWHRHADTRNSTCHILNLRIELCY